METKKKEGISPLRISRALKAARAAMNCNGRDVRKATAWLERDIERQYAAFNEAQAAFLLGAPGPKPATPVSIGDLELAIKYIRSGAWEPVQEAI